ncbi:MAG: molybdenum cofactor guanylyltransferase [Clostridiales bacterium]|nr:molybdenum cofactor guanylyltransferase [Clostridiales bacterium]
MILCGGKSKRTGFDKSFAKIGGKYIIETIYEKLSECFENVRLCADSKERLAMFGMETLEDRITGKTGPAVAIHSALSSASSEYVFVTACDMPLINTGHIEFMMRMLERSSFAPDAMVPVNGEYIEPLYSFYSAGIAGLFEEEIERGNFRISSILKRCNALYLEERYSKMFDEGLAMFSNINYMEDLEKIASLGNVK